MSVTLHRLGSFNSCSLAFYSSALIVPLCLPVYEKRGWSLYHDQLHAPLMHQQPTKMFLDLPNELLYIICGLVSSRGDLLSLANACRQLHFFVYPIYFSRHGIDIAADAMVFTYQDGSLKALPGLATYLGFIGRSLTSVSCSFKISTKSTVAKIKDVLELKRFIVKLSSVYNVYLRLETPLHRVWEEVILELLDLILQKSCVKLQFYSTLYSTPEATSRKLPATLDSFKRSSLRSSTRWSLLNKLKPTLFPDPSFSLKVCHIPRLPYFLQPWYINVLNSSVVKDLSFNSIMMHERDGQFFSSLNLPQLTHISFQQSSLSSDFLFKFFANHPSITSLELVNNNISPPRAAIFPGQALRNLETLRTTSEHLVHVFLSWRGFRSLTCIDIVAGSFFYEPERAFACLRGLVTDIKLILSLKMEAGFELWLSRRSREDAARNAARVAIVGNATTNSGKDSPVNQSQTEASNSEAFYTEQRLRRIKSIEINTSGEKGYHLGKETLKYCVAWLRKFPELEHVAFTAGSLHPNVGSSVKRWFCSALVKECPKLKTVYLVSNRDWFERVRDDTEES